MGSYNPSLFQKGGVDPKYYWLIPLIITVCSAIWVFPMDKLKIIEKLIVSIFVSITALFIAILFMEEGFISWRYRDKTWALWENDERIITNMTFYGITALLVIGITALYKKVRRLLTEPIRYKW